MRIHYSWIIVAITFFTIIVVGVVTASGGVFLTPFEEHFGWNRSMISLACISQLKFEPFSQLKSSSFPVDNE